ncbi:hypothetical protein BC831DRAFT_507395 [Entophlyctis helioformis]|nr:hypothetical protein BC831DRAFT_507395 [Entophlyctis helioformis]
MKVQLRQTLRFFSRKRRYRRSSMTVAGLLRVLKLGRAVLQAMLQQLLPQQPPLQQPPPQQQTATAATATAATTTAATTHFSGMLHVDVLSVFFSQLVATAAISMPDSIDSWKDIVQPAFQLFMASVGDGHTIKFHVDGRRGDAGIKIVHHSRALKMLHAVVKVLRYAFRRQEYQQTGSLSKDEMYALNRFYTLTQTDKQHIVVALSELAGKKKGCTVCWCDYEADCCIARHVRESSDKPVVVVSNDSDLVAHCAGHCAVILTHLEHGQLVQMRSYNHGGLATMASVLGVRDFAGACQLVAALSRTDFFGRNDHGLAAAVKFVNARFDAKVEELNIKAAQLCAILETPNEAKAFMDTIKDAYIEELVKNGDESLVQSFKNAFEVFVNRNDVGASAGAITAPIVARSEPQANHTNHMDVNTTPSVGMKCLMDGCCLSHTAQQQQQAENGVQLVHLTRGRVEQLVSSTVGNRRLDAAFDEVKGCHVALDTIIRCTVNRLASSYNAVTHRNILAAICKAASAQL